MLDLPKILVYNVNINFLEVFMKPNYVAKKSAWTAVSIWTILLCWLIVPIIIMIFKIIALKAETIEFYDQKVVQRSGILAKQERQSLLTNITSVSVNQSLLGRIFNYGNVQVDLIGKWDINTDGVSNPHILKEFLEDYLSNKNMNQVIMK